MKKDAICSTRSREILVEPIDSDPYLVLEIAIQCPACGLIEIQLLGHHLPVLKRIIDQAITEQPHLTLGPIPLGKGN